MKIISALILAAGALVAAALSGVAGPEPAVSAAADTQNGITVTGTGAVTTVPDEAEFSFGVTTHAGTAAAALAANGEAMRRVTAALRGAEVRTEQVSLSPRYSENGTEIVGYTATNTVLARIRNLARAGAFIDAAVEAGANQVYGPSLTSSERDELYREALRAAYAEARAKAQTLAAAADISLGRAVDVVEAGGPVPLPMAEMAARVADTAIEPGTQEIQATVTVTFATS